jgi:hypothetical protein
MKRLTRRQAGSAKETRSIQASRGQAGRRSLHGWSAARAAAAVGSLTICDRRKFREMTQDRTEWPRPESEAQG